MPKKSTWNQAFNDSTYIDGYGVEREDYRTPLADTLKEIIDNIRIVNAWLNPTNDGIELTDPATKETIKVTPTQGLGILELLNPEAQAALITRIPKARTMQKLSDVPDLINNGRRNAVEYLSSLRKKAVDRHNEKLAQRLANRYPEYAGFKNFKASTNIDRAKELGDLRFTRGINNEAGSYTRISSNPADDITEINLDFPHRADATMFHETLHSGNYGSPARRDNVPPDIVRSQEDFYDFLNQKIRNKVPYNEYLDNMEYGEIATNLREIGYQNGINPDVPYPGKDRALEIYNTLSQDPEKGSIFKYLNLDKPERLWRALNGTYYGRGGKIDNATIKANRRVNFIGEIPQ